MKHISSTADRNAPLLYAKQKMASKCSLQINRFSLHALVCVNIRVQEDFSAREELLVPLDSVYVP